MVTQKCCFPTCGRVCCWFSKSSLNPVLLILIRLLMVSVFLLACTAVNINFRELKKYMQQLRMLDTVFPRVIWPFWDDRPLSGKKMIYLLIGFGFGLFKNTQAISLHSDGTINGPQCLQTAAVDSVENSPLSLLAAVFFFFSKNRKETQGLFVKHKHSAIRDPNN